MKSASLPGTSERLLRFKALHFWLAILTPGYFLWLLPIVLGWVVAIPLTALLGDLPLGERARRAGVFTVPAEVQPAGEIRALARVVRSGLTNRADLTRRREIWTTPALV